LGDDQVWVDVDEIAAWERDNPQAYDRDAYLGLHDDHHGVPEAAHTADIGQLAREGLSKLGAPRAYRRDRRALR
jgi:hypothetical protein